MNEIYSKIHHVRHPVPLPYHLYNEHKRPSIARHNAHTIACVQGYHPCRNVPPILFHSLFVTLLYWINDKTAKILHPEE